MLLILTVAGTVYAQDNSIVWTNIIVNSDLSGEDLSCFYSREYPGGIATPTVEDNVIVVNSPAMVDVQWESVFWVVIPQNLEDGTRVKVSFKCKASAETTANTQCHNAPNDYLHYNCFGDVPFTTEWNTYSTVFSVPSACGGNFHSIAFILTKDEDITYYFDNIVVAVDKALAVNSSLPLS